MKKPIIIRDSSFNEYMAYQSNRVLLYIHELFFDRKPIIKNSSYYTKLYSSKQAKENEKTITAQTIAHIAHITFYRSIYTLYFSTLIFIKTFTCFFMISEFLFSFESFQL